MMIGFVAVIGVVIGTTLWLRGELVGLRSDVKSDISGLKASIRSIDESQRRMEKDLAFIKGAFVGGVSWPQGRRKPGLQGWREPGLRRTIMSIVAYIDGKTAKLEREIQEIRARRKRRRKEYAEVMAALRAGEVIDPEVIARFEEWDARTGKSIAQMSETNARVAEWEAWYERWSEAKACGEPFDEPVPSVLGDD